MSDSGIPKGQMSAFQRWEMASFGDERPAQVAERTLAVATAARAHQEEAHQARESARKEGYAAGYKEAYALGLQQGQEDGHREGYASGKEIIDAELEGVRAVAHHFAEQIASANTLVAQDVFRLALDLSEAMLRTSLELDPALVLPVVREAVESLPSVQRPAQLILHPKDAEIVRSHMGDELDKDGWRIVADSHMEPGGCKLETAQNLVDASVSTRWHRLTDAMKKHLPQG
ncbi:flagellar assembly protein FliH [Undibacterium sp.]|uniref:flagellar assembly protein FliH n=1 Tax=Undibacterium sp. TaxID=1914977 RepID=UPI002C12AB7B|nr:flagellar assembly protein FliH [Undibacterium sp.]HTD06454.1 flagellar assembly protein FliH [Undibacterium sp.]